MTTLFNSDADTDKIDKRAVDCLSGTANSLAYIDFLVGLHGYVA